jgi:RimJ/RimL family protein N-acetyltransferase
MPRFAEALAITTERLHLTPIEVDDADDLYAILRDPRIGGAMLEESPPSVDVVRSNIVSWLRGPPAEREEAWLNWLVRTHRGTAVGQLAATVQPRGTWLAWIVGVEHQGLGYASEAARGVTDSLTAQGVTTYLASIREGHDASERVARSLGFELTDETADGERVWSLTDQRARD